MAKLILSMDNLVLREVSLDKERISIGRKPTNDVQIDNLAISGQHAAVVTILDDSFLEDLDSTNGTFVNGQQVKKHFLQNNDVIELGKYRLKYVKEAGQQAVQADLEKTMVLRPDMLRKSAEMAGARPAERPAPMMPPVAPAPAFPPPFATPQPQQPQQPPAQPPAFSSPPFSGPAAVTPPSLSSQPSMAPISPVASPSPPPVTQAAPFIPAAPAAAPPPAPVLGAIQVLTGSNAGRTLDLVKPLTTLGKPGVQVAVIARRPQGYFLTHVEGARVPMVNGVAIDTQAHALKSHDVIELAGVKMEFFLKD